MSFFKHKTYRDKLYYVMYFFKNKLSIIFYRIENEAIMYHFLNIKLIVINYIILCIF